MKIENDTTKIAEAKAIKSDLSGLIRPRPNSKILGMRVKLWFYNILGTPKKTNSIRSRLKNKFGEPPVLASSVDLKKNEEITQNRLENRGYFTANVKGDTVGRNRKVTATYVAKTGQQYLIASVNFPTDTSSLERAMAGTVSKTILKTGEPYNLDVIKGERIRIDQALKEQGFYFFSSEYLIARADSTTGENKVNLYMDIKPSIPSIARKIFTIDDVYIYSNYSLTQTQADTSKANAVYYEGYHVIDGDSLFKPQVFRRTMFFDPGDVYNRRDHNLSLNRLVNLGAFKFVKNRFEVDPNENNKLDVFYYLTPLPNKSLRAEILGTTKSNNNTGTQLNINWRNRNAFGQAEQISVTAYAASEIQVSGTQRGYNTFRFGGEGTLAVPRFLIPFFDVNTTNEFLPRSKVVLGYEYLNKRKLYGINSFRGELGYDWKSDILRQHELLPVSINYVQQTHVTDEFKRIIDSTPELAPSLLKAIEEQFIIGSRYSFLYNNQTQFTRKNNFYFNGTADLAGNVLGLLMGANAKNGNEKKLFNSTFSQYIRLDGDVRHYLKLGATAKWANRLFLGFGLPYGNSTELPFIKQYFTGGSSSNRAFRSRSVGPGTFRPSNASVRNFLPEQSGDVKIELNTEYRTRLSGIVNGAVFVDAGNIWLYNENPGKPGGKFDNDFLKELAIGTGVGLRFDITFLIVRADLATPVRKPWLPPGQRFVLNDFNFGNSQWRKENLVFNLAVGYPF
ncbi:MAG TPA: BamA/TamA family outer membrane protein [Sphingobacteriaceae bacterium]|nr:BamA/TamA family outer membrane protein [Sphingobacteriaceae bacterium]